MTDTLFGLTDFAPPAPEWATACFYCTPDETGYFDERRHLDDHQVLTCGICGGTSPNRLLFTMSHGVSLGASWKRDALMCSGLDLCLNHLSYAVTHREPPAARDLDRVVPTGWRIAPDGAQIRPAHWPCGWFACSSGIALSLERGAVSSW